MFVASQAVFGKAPVRRRVGAAAPAALILHSRPAIRERLRGFFQQGECLRVVAEATAASAAVETLRRYQLDYFLCELSDDGLRGLRKLRESALDVPTAVIFEGEPDFDLLSEAMRLETKVCICVDDYQQAMAGVEALTTGRPYSPAKNPRIAPERSSLDGFNDREKMILGWLAEGRCPRAIAAELFLSVSTIKGYLSRIYDKLGVTRRPQAILAARKLLG